MPTPWISLAHAQSLAESRETGPEIFLAISAVLDTDDDALLLKEWAEGTHADAVTAFARTLVAPGEDVCWGAEGALPHDTAHARDQLRAAIDRSGLSARAYAERVLLRDERTVRRWLAGDSPIPAPVLNHLALELTRTA